MRGERPDIRRHHSNSQTSALLGDGQDHLPDSTIWNLWTDQGHSLNSTEPGSSRTADFEVAILFRSVENQCWYDGSRRSWRFRSQKGSFDVLEASKSSTCNQEEETADARSAEDCFPLAQVQHSQRKGQEICTEATFELRYQAGID